MRKFLAFMLLAVPFITFAQSGPQMQVSNLQTDQSSYNAGQEITGSFVLNNIGDVNIPDLQYYVAVGNYGQDGGTLENETSATPISEAIYLPAAARLEVPFSITPQSLPEGDLGLHVYVTQKNGMLLGLKKMPLTVTGERTSARLIEGYFEVGGEQYSLESNMPFAPEEGASFTLTLPEGTPDGTHDVRMTIYEKSVGQEVVSDQTIAVDFVDGLGQVLLPEGLKAKQYAGQVSLAKGSNVLSIKYSITGPQAEVLGVDTDLLSLKNGQDFVVTLTYADTPLNGRDPEATEYPENLAVKIKVLNEKGKVVNEYQQALEVTQKQDLLEVNDESTEEEQEEATRRLEIMLSNTRVLDIPLSAKASAKNLSFEVELYDEVTGQVYDTYKTSFPAAPESYPARAVLLATFASILILLVIIFKTAKHKIPMVCIALLVGLGVSAAVIVKDAAAWIADYDYATYNSHVFNFIQPLSSRNDGYDVGDYIPFELNVSATAWAGNGFLIHQVRHPVYTSGWRGFTSASAALSHIQSNPNHNNESLYYRQVLNGTLQKTFTATYGYVADSTAVGVPNERLSPGKHWIPASSRFCTASHGCSGHSYVAFEICVNGAGVCPGENTGDMCANIAGTQTTVPAGYQQDGANCTAISCVSNQGDACGCGGAGTIQCDGSCKSGGVSVPLSCPSTLDVSCAVSASTISSAQNVQFDASATGNSGAVSYLWSNVGTGVSYGSDDPLTRMITETTQLKLVGEDADGNEDEDYCTVTYESSTCDPGTRPSPSSCYSCQASSWVPNGSCSVGTDVTASFKFQPNIVSSQGGQCTLNIMSASNVEACRPVKTSNGQSDFGTAYPAVGQTTITNDTSVQVPVGTYNLQCKGSDPEDPDTFEPIAGLSPKQCIGAPIIIER